MMPAGQLSVKKSQKLIEPVWSPSAVHIAKKFEIPIVPMFISARNSSFHYTLHKINPKLRDMTAFREILNKKNSTVKVTIGHLSMPEEFIGSPIANINEIRKEVFDTLATGTLK